MKTENRKQKTENRNNLIYFVLVILFTGFFTSCDKNTENTNSTIYKKAFALADENGNKIDFTIKSNKQSIIKDISAQDFEMVLKTRSEYEGIPSIQLPNSPQESVSKPLFPAEKGYMLIEITDFVFSDDIKGFNVIPKQGKLSERWRNDPIPVFNSTTVGWRISGYDNKYTETAGRCSIEYEVWSAKVEISVNGFKPERRIARERLSSNNERLIRYFGSSDLGKDMYFHLWDEDGWGCDIDEVFLNGNFPTSGFLWLRN